MFLDCLNPNLLPVEDAGGLGGFHIGLFKDLTEVFCFILPLGILLLFIRYSFCYSVKFFLKKEGFTFMTK